MSSAGESGRGPAEKVAAERAGHAQKWMPPVETAEEKAARDRRMAEMIGALKSSADWQLLPADPNYRNPLLRFVRHRGIVLTNFHLASGCEEQWRRFRARTSDVVVASFPKSGTTWLQEIVWRLVHGETGAGSGDAPLEYRFPLLDMPGTKRMRMEPLEEMVSPRLLKTHLMHHLLPGGLADSGAKILYISRDACDVCVSYYHFSRIVNYEQYQGTFAEFRERFVRGEVMNGPYREHVKGYLEHADTVLCLTYEELHANIAEAIRRIAAFLGKQVSTEDVDSIAHCTSFATMKDNPNANFEHWKITGMITKGQEGVFMRKGKVGDSKNYFTEEEREAFMKWRNEKI